jgi:hypothetical protein
MADPTPTPTPAPAPAPKSNSKRGEINQSWLDEFTNGEAILAAAKPADRAAKLTDGGIDAGKITTLTAVIAAARTLAGKAVQGTSDKEIITDDEDALKTALLEQIHYVQKRARQKYDATEPGRLKDFAISQPIGNSRSLLEQAANNILLKLKGDDQAKPAVPPDVLPGVPPARITALQTALDDYTGVQGDQSEAQGRATTWRKQVEAAVAGIIAKRREIQFAADAEWPHTDPANAGIRVEFQLPPDRVMK